MNNEEYEEYEYEEYNEENNRLYDQQLEIILLQPFNGFTIGDIITVNSGIYNTLINLKKGLPLNCYDDELTDKQKLVINAKNLEEDIQKYQEVVEELKDENFDLKEKNMELETKIEKLEQLKDKRTKKKTVEYNNKMIKEKDIKTK